MGKTRGRPRLLRRPDGCYLGGPCPHNKAHGRWKTPGDGRHGGRCVECEATRTRSGRQKSAKRYHQKARHNQLVHAAAQDHTEERWHYYAEFNPLWTAFAAGEHHGMDPNSGGRLMDRHIAEMMGGEIARWWRPGAPARRGVSAIHAEGAHLEYHGTDASWTQGDAPLTDRAGEPIRGSVARVYASPAKTEGATRPTMVVSRVDQVVETVPQLVLDDPNAPRRRMEAQRGGDQATSRGKTVTGRDNG